jgi:hypothetical protein
MTHNYPDYPVKYYLKLARVDEEFEVSRDRFIHAERSAGFRPKSGNGVATGGFTVVVGVSGRIEYVK